MPPRRVHPSSQSQTHLRELLRRTRTVGADRVTRAPSLVRQRLSANHTETTSSRRNAIPAQRCSDVSGSGSFNGMTAGTDRDRSVLATRADSSVVSGKSARQATYAWVVLHGRMQQSSRLPAGRVRTSARSLACGSAHLLLDVPCC
jgi:hypothetical protein